MSLGDRNYELKTHVLTLTGTRCTAITPVRESAVYSHACFEMEGLCNLAELPNAGVMLNMHPRRRLQSARDACKRIEGYRQVHPHPLFIALRHPPRPPKLEYRPYPKRPRTASPTIYIIG